MKSALFAGRRLPRAMLVSLCSCLLFAALPAVAAEFFVNKQGHDANNGASMQTAFLTIQQGVNALNPGDTLTIGPGEYLENAKRDNLGSADADTLIRAEIPGTALLRGDVPAPAFKLVAGYRFVYAAPFDQKPQAVVEHDTLRVVMERASASELEFDPGYFHYDAAAKMLYISRADLLSPDQRLYTVSVNDNSGLDLSSPRRVIIDGLAATGFCPGVGIRLGAPVSCTIRNCVCFMNVSGIELEPNEGLGRGDGGSHNVVENCIAYGNSFGGVVRYGANNDVVRNCYTYKNVRDGEHFGVMHYSFMTGPLLFQNNISWGQNVDYSVKQGDQQEKVENCVGLGHIRISPNKMSNNLFADGNEYDRGSVAPADTVLFAREQDLNEDVEYADPLNLDFRLQPNSRFRGTAPDKGDRGPYHYEANIFYVSPNGNDEADGLSTRTPWRSLGRAVHGLRPGDTLYLMKGSYAAVNWKNPAGAEKPINVRGRGRDPVLVTGHMVVSGGTGVVFERLNLTGGMTLDGSGNVTFKNCVFSDATEGLHVQSVKGLRATNCLFTGAPLTIATSRDIFLGGNLYVNSGRPAVQLDADAAILYSDYNNYEDAGACWQVAGATLTLADLQKGHDVYSLNMDPQIAVEAGIPVVKNAIQFEGRGLHGTTLGLHREYAEDVGVLSLVGPFLHSTSDTTANIEWWSSAPARYTLTWGDTPEMKTTVEPFSAPERFVSFSLTGLKPGQTYYFNIQTADPSDRNAAVSLPVLHPTNATLTFQTALKPADARVYYVAPNGNDGNDGLSRDRAFQTVNYAATKVGPGDTVLLYDGKYDETVRIRAAGTQDRPITVRAAPGEKPAFDGDYLLKTFIMTFKPDYRFDGLYLSAEEFWGEGYVIRYSDRVQITRCLNITITAENSPDLVIRNCVTRGGWSAMGLGQCPNSVVENNVSVMTILRHVSADAPTILRNNIFCECVRNKAHQQLLDLNLDNVKESNNCFYMRWPADEKLAVNDETLTIYKARHGSGSIAANPMMPGTPGWAQGWQQSSDKDFDQFFTTNPDLILRGIGLQPEAFSDFRFEGTKWPYDRTWAEGIVTARNAADALVKAGKDGDALTAYTTLAAKTQMSDRVKADILERAFLCAFRLENSDRAMQLAKSIPVEVIAMKCQIQMMLAQKQYAALINAFSEAQLGGRSFSTSFVYPELEDVMADLYYCRSIAHSESGNLDAAEADLKVMNDKRAALQYSSGEAIHDRTWLRLGDFYRQYRQDDHKALDAYLQVCSRTTYAPHGTVPKPVLTGASDTLIHATKSACDILNKQGKNAEVKKLQADLAKAQAEAAAALNRSRNLN